MNRRQTLGVLSDANFNSSLPPNATKSKIGRQSLGPPRMSMGGRNNMSGLVDGMAGLSVNSRTSDVRTSGVNRRSSVYSGRTSGIGAMGALQIIKDPRPIRDKSWQGNAIRTLINFLVQAGYNQPISVKTLQAPSAKDFQNIFKFLYAQLDPKYVFQKKFEEEVPVMMKGMRYPFADQISKSHLYSVGSMHSWPTLLAMLTWMVELICCCDQLDASSDMEEESGLYPIHNQAERMFFDYLGKAYSFFLAGNDNYDGMDDDLIGNFDRKNEQTIKDVEKLQRENEILEEEHKALTENESPLVTLEKEHVTLTSDREKFKQYIQYVEEKKKKYTNSVAKTTEDMGDKGNELEQLSAERAQLQAVVDNQELSPADVDRMRAEQEQLKKNLEVCAQKLEQINQTVWEKEIQLQKKMDQLEKLVQDYNMHVYRLGLSSPDSPMANGVKFEAELNTHGTRTDQMLSIDLRNSIKPALVHLRTKFNGLFHKAQEDSLMLQETLDRLNEAVQEKSDEVKEMESRIKQLTEQYNNEKEAIGAQNNATNSEIEQLERTIQQMRFEGTTELLMAQQKVQKVGMEYDQLVRKANDAKEKVMKEAVKAIDELLIFQQHISNSIADLEKLATEEVNDAADLSAKGRQFLDDALSEQFGQGISRRITLGGSLRESAVAPPA